MIKKLLNKIPINRLILYMMVLALSPTFFIAWSALSKKEALEAKRKHLEVVQEKCFVDASKSAFNEKVRRHFFNSDPHYTEKNLGSLSFLAREKDALEKLMGQKDFPGSEALSTRHHFVTSPSNRLTFLATSLSNENQMYETEEKLKKSVELDLDDLRKVLTIIENKELEGAPFLTITDFEIERKVLPNNAEVFELKKLKLLKREFEKHD